MPKILVLHIFQIHGPVIMHIQVGPCTAGTSILAAQGSLQLLQSGMPVSAAGLLLQAVSSCSCMPAAGKRTMVLVRQ